METIQSSIKWFARQGIFTKLSVGCLGLMMLCCLCTVPAAILRPSIPTPSANSTSIVNVAPTSIATQSKNETISPTDTHQPTDMPTDMPAATQTAEPTPTQNVNLIKIGTYLVGTDIEPGIYRGEAGDGLLGSCYWARLKDLSGSLDGVLANENAVGQYYVEVKSSDTALN